ncbi:cytochrome b5-like [Onthophagus taurus]|uniref:cytochrome b5-like n=1 Tax=Onthophagus taurus TaxID=166361 RepID=UPI000C204392|nr:cytochrome b5-like [Onthophagus taurus]
MGDNNNNSENAVIYYSLEEISKNTGLNGTKCWIIYKNIVYDVSDYITEHPGGSELVTEYGGKESTKAFDDAGHSTDAKNMLKPYKIGELAMEDRNQKGVKKNIKSPDTPYRRGCLNIVSCGLLG